MTAILRDILKKNREGEVLSRPEILHLLSLPAASPETAWVMAEAARLSRELSDGRAEIHAQFAVNLAPCHCDCLFCSFAEANGVFSSASEVSQEEAVAYSLQFEAEGANAIYLMATAQFSLARYLELAREVRSRLKPETLLIANVGDMTEKHARQLVDAGFTGVYHALRLREGVDTRLDPEARKRSIRIFQEAGLRVGTCVEPVGPEHSAEELADLIAFTASIAPAFSGAARRISIPGTPMAEKGMITELRMAQIVAVTRLAMPRTVLGNCTHEPCTLGALGSANLFWAEMGANPRDVEEKTEKGRGTTLGACHKLFQETHWEVLQGPSRFFSSSISGQEASGMPRPQDLSQPLGTTAIA